MQDPTLSTALSAALETAINKALRYDPATRANVRELQGRSLAININELSLALAVIFGDGQISMRSYLEAPDTILSGSLPALLRLATSRSTSLAGSGICAEGDLELVQSIHKILSEVEVDWEEALNDRLGDVAGHQLAQLLRGQWQWLRQRDASGRRLLSEFLSEELRAVPSAAELRWFSEQVDEMRLACDRAEARLLQLQTRRGGAESRESS